MTAVSFCHDANSLFIAFYVLEGPELEVHVADPRRDGAVYNGEDVEVFIAAEDGRSYLHFAVDPEGNQYDAKGTDASWNGEWTCAVKKIEYFDLEMWTCRLVIPFSTIGINPDNVKSIRANFCRTRCPTPGTKREFSSMVVTGDSFHNPEAFATLTFGDIAAIIFQNGLAAPLQQASSPASVGVVAGNKETHSAVISGISEKGARPLASAMIEPGKEPVEIRFPIPLEGPTAFRLEVADSKGNIILRTSDFPAGLPNVSARFDECKALLAETRKVLEEVGTERDTKQIQRIAEAVAKMDAYLKEAGEKPVIVSAEKYPDAVAALARMTNRFRSFHISAMATIQSGSNFPAFAVSVWPGMTKVCPDDEIRIPPKPTVKLSACRNEYENFQIAVLPVSGSVKNVAIEASALSGPGGGIPAQNIQVRREGYIKVAGSEWPDPLFESSVADVPANGRALFWITVFVPPGTAPGKYQGTISVSAPSLPRQVTTIPLEVNVWDFELETETHLQSSFWLFRHPLRNFYGMTEFPMETYKAWLDMACRHRLSPIEASEFHDQPLIKIIKRRDGSIDFDFTLFDEYLAFCMERGMPSFNMGDNHWFGSFFNSFDALDEATGKIVRVEPSPEERTALFEKYSRDALKHFTEKGWAKKAYLQSFDEPGEDKALLEQIRANYDACRRGWPGLRTLITSAPQDRPALAGSIGIWVPLTPNYVPDIAEKRRTAGEEVWWYVCCAPQAPYANFFIAEKATNHRILFWQTWKYRSQGLLYWGLNHWPAFAARKNMDPITENARWPNVEWDDGGRNGDGYFMYPGPGGRPLSSVRLEVMRDGVEDWEYLRLLDALLAQASAKGVPPGIISQARKAQVIGPDLIASMTEYTSDCGKIADKRIEIGEAIQALNEAMKQER